MERDYQNTASNLPNFNPRLIWDQIQAGSFGVSLTEKHPLHTTHRCEGASMLHFAAPLA